MWAVLYDDGMSLTTATEQIAHILAEAERQQGRHVTVRRMDDAEAQPRGVEKPARPGPKPISEPGPAPAPEPAQALEPVQAAEPASAPEPAPAPEPAQAQEPVQAAELASAPEPASEALPPAREPEPGRAPTPIRRRRLLLYALAAVSIVVAAALAGHWGVLPRVGANTSSGATQVGGTSHGSQLLPPLEQPPVMHFSNAVDATSTPADGDR